MLTQVISTRPKRLAVGLALVARVGVTMRSLSASGGNAAGKALVIPKGLASKAEAGRIAFDANCARCHGANAASADHGPPFVHVIYNRGHLPDEAFQYAARYGVRSHHWNFGDMPPQPQVNEQDVAAIVAYVRALREANGTLYQPHRM